MNRIAETFQRLEQARQKALVGFVTAGDPDPERSLAIIQAMCDNGVDILEFGVPFSDPTASSIYPCQKHYLEVYKIRFWLTIAAVFTATRLRPAPMGY